MNPFARLQRLLIVTTFFLASAIPVYADKSHASHSGGTVSVHGYTRKDGTYVAPHTRSAAKTSPSSFVPAHPPRSSVAAPTASQQYPGVTLRDDHGRIKRSEEAKRAFMKQTGFTHGRPGYVIDHVKPLCRGGADAPSNMQWQTIAEAKAKDRTECH